MMKTQMSVLGLLVGIMVVFLSAGIVQADEGGPSDFTMNLILQGKEVRDDIEVSHYTFPRENEVLDCFIMKPAGNGPFPGIVVNHGGYNSASGFGIENGMDLAKNGYVAIACDYTHKNLRRDGVQGLKEGWECGASEENISRALQCIEILKGLDFVDDRKIAVMGNSMGGFLTLGVSQRTDAIRAAVVVVAGIKDGNPQNPADNVIEVISPPEDLVKDISCPLLILNAENDQKVDTKYPKHLKALLDEHGKTSNLIIYADMDHSLLRSMRETAYGEILSFLDENLNAEEQAQKESDAR